jgi:dolichyl-phosphate-mannose-protein mannosyltransferase
VTDVSEVDPEAPQSPDDQSWFARWRGFLLPLAVVGAGLLIFDGVSSGSSVAKRGIVSQRPPIYGYYRPTFTRWGIAAIAAAVIAGLIAFALSRLEAPRKRLVLPVVVALLLSFGTALAIIPGSTHEFVGPLSRVKGGYADYAAEVPLVRKLGVRTFIKDHATLIRTHRLVSVHSRTHPPGPEVVVSILKNMSPGHLIPAALILAFISSLVVMAGYFIALRVAGQRAALIAALLLAVAPAPGVFIFLSFDAVYATLLAGSAALLVWGLSKNGRPLVAFLGGLALGLSSIMTYAVLFVAAFAFIYALFARPWKEAIRSLAYAAIGGVLALLVLRLALGFDFIASYRASLFVVPHTKRSYLYWIFGNPATWLTFAGVPIAAFALRELFFKRPAWLLTFLAPLLVADLTKIFPGETERIGQFATPFIAAAAAAALVRWETTSGRKRPGLIALLVVITATQAIVLQALFNTVW